MIRTTDTCSRTCSHPWALLPVWVVMVFLLPVTKIHAQCDTGTEPECMCSTAPVLCTVDELDMYSFSMSDYQHPEDGPNPLCPGPGNQNSVPNNPTWFAFIAWCTTLTINVHPTNCTPFQGGTNGVQVAIYSDCNYTAVECNVMSADCNTNDKVLTMNNLQIGNTYYFLIDGCLGAYCDVEIDVIGMCGEATIDDWSEPIDGPTEICAGTSPTFSIEDLDGATHYHWYVDGVLVEEGLELTEFSTLWDTPGTYEICVDASNVPCIPESDPPDPLCMTVEVFQAEAGDIMANPNPVCPNDVIYLNATGYNTDPGYHEYIVITDESGTIVEVVEGDAAQWTFDMCGTFFGYSYNFHDASLTGIPSVGDNITSIDCMDGCCDQDMVPLDFVDDEAPEFVSVPADLALTCFDLVPPMQDLMWTDNCDGSGTVAGVEAGTADLCNGGTLTRTWEYTDQCGNSVSHVQTLTIDPLPLADFLNPPADVTVDCSNIPSSAPDLQVQNGAAGACEINTSVSATQNGSADVCGGSFAFEWTYTDVCNRTITHVQNVTVTQIQEPAFVSSPNDTTIMCDAIPTGAPSLDYTNGGTGSCEISGSVVASVNGSADFCGGQISYQWDFTDICGRSITETQSITVEPVPQAQFVTLPADTTIMCDAIPNTHPDLSYTNGLSGSCLIAGTVSPTVVDNSGPCGGTITRTWQFTDACGRSTQWQQTITVDPAPEAMWINPPQDTSIDCSDLPSQIPALSYTNGGSGSCQIAGSVPGVQTIYDLCQGIVQWQWQFTDACSRTITHTQTFTTSPPPPVVFANPPADVTVACGQIPQPIPVLSYTNNTTGPCLVQGTVQGAESGNLDYCGGQLIRTWMITDPCGVQYMHTQTISMDPAPPAVFTNLPADVTMSCENIPPVPPGLAYNNGQTGICAISGTVPATVSGNYNACGGALTYNWQFTDNCGRMISHVQNVAVTPAPPPVFQNPPVDVTINCEDATNTPPNLTYSNGLNGQCGISGSVAGTASGSYDECGGMLAFQWTYTDACGTMINHVQQITVMPAADPVWVDPPDDITLGCDDIYEDPPPLNYTNNLNSPCGISGTVQATTGISGNIYTHLWSFTHPCTGEFVEYEQNVTIVPPVELNIEPTEVFICAGEDFDLSTVLVEDINGSVLTVTYHSGLPADDSNILPSETVTPLSDTDYFILGTNEYGCTDVAIFNVFLEPNPDAGDDAEVSVCLYDGVDLNDYLSSGAEPDGYWSDVNGTGIDISDPGYVTFSDVEPGVYVFQYVVEGTVCPEDAMDLQITVAGEPEFTVDSVYCTNSNTSYTVVITGANLQVVPDAGTVVVVSPTVTEITGIPIDQSVTFDLWDTGPYCVYNYTITPPNCDCPNVPPPVNVGNKEICLGDAIPLLEVTVSNGTIANWYDMPTGGTLLAQDVLSYLPPVAAAGTYIYYVGAESIEFPGCVSNVRIPVTLVIRSLPVANDVSDAICDDQQTGSLEVDLTMWQGAITPNAGNVVTFFGSLSDAQSGTGQLSMPVTLTSGVNSYHARIEDVNGCSGYAQLEITLDPLPAFDVQAIPETCPGDNDGVVIITGYDPGQSYTVSFNGSNYTDVWMFNALEPTDYTIVVTSMQTGCTSSANVTIAPGVQLNLTLSQLECHDNGTDTDASDDYYTIGVIATTNGSGLAYELLADGNALGILPYSMPQQITLPASGVSATLTVIDTLTGCETSLTTPLLTTCSSNCEITVNAITQECNDNGTPTDPGDDYHVLTFNASAINGAVTNLFTVTVDGVPAGTFTYGQDVVLNIPVASPPSAILLTDAADPQCFESLPLQPFTSCSGSCSVPVPVVDFVCSDNGTPDDGSDDYYTFSFVPSVINQGASNVVDILVDGAQQLTVAPGSVAMITIPADGLQHTIEIVYTDTETCSASWVTDILTPCSSQCTITVTNEGAACNDNSTPFDPTDDTYTIEFTAHVVFGAADNMFSIDVDGGFYDDGVYDQPQEVILSADGMVHVITLADHDDGQCTYVIETPPLTSCSDSCQLIVSIFEIYCDNAGTNQTEADDEFYAIIRVDGVNVQDGWQVQLPPVTGVLGQTDTIGPFLISDGDAILLVEADSGNCQTEITLEAPLPCSLCEQSIEAGPDQVLDCGTPSVLLTLQSSEPGTYTWTDPLGQVSQGISIDANLPGMYIAIASFNDGCQLADTVNITSDPSLPTISGGPDRLLDCEVREVTLTAQVLSGTGPFDIQWTDMDGNVLSTNNQLLVDMAGTYFVQAYDNAVDCWTARDAVNVADISNEPSALILATPGDILSCLVETIHLSTVAEPNVEYTWVVGGQPYSGNDLEIDEAVTIVIIAVDTITHCSALDSIVITELIEYPVILTDPVNSLSCDNPEGVIDASSSIPNFGNFTWTDISGDTLSNASVLPITLPGTYILELVDPFNGCTSTDTFTVQDISHFPVILDGQDVQLPCNATRDTIEIELLDPPGSVLINWKTVDGQIISAGNATRAIVEGPGVYYSEVTDLVSGCTSVDSIVVQEITDRPSVILAATYPTSCALNADGVLVIDGTTGGTAPYIYMLDGVPVSEGVLDGLAAGEYMLQVTDANGCSSDTLLYVEAGDEFSIDLEAEIKIALGEEYLLEAQVTIPEDEIETVQWSPAAYLSCDTCLTTIAAPVENMSYTIDVTDIFGCTAMATVQFLVREDYNIFVPNVFTPGNGDGVNDFLTVYTNQLDATVTYLEIFDRWGNLVFGRNDFEPNVPALGWDGTFKGQLMNPAVFVYSCEIQFSNGTTQRLVGDVTIIR